MLFIDTGPVMQPPSLNLGGYYRGSTDQISRFFTADRLRAELTRNQRHLCLVMVGLPGRGKSFISRKLEVFMKWKDGGHAVCFA